MIKVNETVLRKASAIEDATIAEIKAGLADGTVVIPANDKRGMKRPCAIGKGMKTKANEMTPEWRRKVADRILAIVQGR